MRISDWSSDVCSSDLQLLAVRRTPPSYLRVPRSNLSLNQRKKRASGPFPSLLPGSWGLRIVAHSAGVRISDQYRKRHRRRSEEHTSELQSLMRISYAVFCLKKKKTQTKKQRTM